MKEQFEKEFISFQPQLRSYLFRLTASIKDCEDLSQDTFIKVFDNIDSFSNKSSFKTWVFTIATNLARDNFRVSERWGSNWMDLVRDAHVENPKLFAKKKAKIESNPDAKFVLSEHLNYCFNCTTKTLLLQEQICLWLKEVYDFKISEIMLILELSEGKVKHAIADARHHLSRIFEKKCALVNKKGTCSQCTGLNQLYNPEQDAHIEANKIKMVKEQKGKNYDQLLNLRLALVKSIDPLSGSSISLHHYLIEHSPKWAKQQLKKQTT
ncbi:MAG: RNA polymerase sigma factor [Marinoscillum sp.]